MRFATWNIGSSVNDMMGSIEQIAKITARNSIDIICFQEIITSGNSIDYLQQLKEGIGFKYMEAFELSSAHIDQTTQMGIAILSRYQITNAHTIKLTNPCISFHKNGKILHSDDKGFLCAEIIYMGQRINVLTGHMLPFHSLGSDSAEHIDIYNEMYQKILPYCQGIPSIIGGDFNSSKLTSIVPQFSIDFLNTFNKPTRYNGKQNDYIFTSKEWIVENTRVESTEGFDHFVCIVDVDLKTQNDITILHLSDLHYGSPDLSIDQKTTLSNVSTSDIRLNEFYHSIEKTCVSINYVVVTGDITTKGNLTGYIEFSNFIEKMRKKKVLPHYNHFVIVPGNHDTDHEKKWNIYDNVLGGHVVRPWLSNRDLNVNELIELFNKVNGDIWGTYTNSDTDAEIHFPILLDTTNRVLIYAFNSSSISQSDIELPKSDRTILDKVKSSKMNKDVKRIVTLLENELKVDPARIDPQEFFLFRGIMDSLEKKMVLSSYYKIAVFHHHITNISCNEEIKKFDEILNGGQLKKELVSRNFQIVLHGHKHNPDVFYDTAVASHKPLLVVAGGTIFGYSNTTHGYYIHRLRKNIMTSTFIQLDAGSSSKTIVNKLGGDLYFKNGLSLYVIYKKVESTVTQHINEMTIGNKTFYGWSKNIEEKRVGSISTAYGILIMELLHSESKYYREKKDAILESLWAFRYKNGGWGAVSQITDMGAPEATAWITLAFYRAHSNKYLVALTDLNIIIDRMINIINSNFTLALIILVLCEVDPENHRIPILCDTLINSAIKSNNQIDYWCVKCKPDLTYKLEPSVVHTAISMIALYSAQRAKVISRNLEEELKKPYELLTDKSKWKNKREAISLQIGEKEDSLIVDYYSVSWILRALMYKEDYIDLPVIQEILDRIVDDYRNGYWDYNGVYYIWTIYDAIATLNHLFLMK